MSDVADAGVSVETPTSTVPVVETPAAARVTDKLPEQFSATPPHSQAAPALQQGPNPVSPPSSQVSPPAPEVPQPSPEIPPAEIPAPEVPQPSPAPQPVPPTNPTASIPATITIKDRLYAALEKVQFRKRAKLEKILVLAKAKRSIRNDDVEKLLRVSDATATNYLSQLVREGKLKRSGIRAGTVYELV